jgi:hypothetical protein
MSALPEMGSVSAKKMLRSFLQASTYHVSVVVLTHPVFVGGDYK